MSPVGADGMVMYTEMVPLSRDLSSQLSDPDVTPDYPKQKDIESASLALTLAQNSLSNRYVVFIDIKIK